MSSSKKVEVLEPLKETGQVGEVIVTSGDDTLTKPRMGDFTIIEPALPPPTLRQGTPGKREVAFSIDKKDPEKRASITNVDVHQISKDDVTGLARSAPLNIEQFDSVVDEIMRQTGSDLYAKAAASAAIAKQEAEMAAKNKPPEFANAILPNDHSDYLRNRPDDPLGYAIGSYMEDHVRHFQPIETVDDLVDFYVNGRKPDLEEFHRQKVALAASGVIPPSTRRPKHSGTNNICLTCRQQGHVPNYCDCCRERNIDNEMQRKQRNLPPPDMPSSFDMGHVCKEGKDSDCDYYCKVIARTVRRSQFV